MNAASVIERAACDGVEIRLSADGAVRLRGPDAAVARWVSALRESKAEVARDMAKRAQPTADQEAELRQLTREVYRDEDEAQQGFALGLIDIEAALPCYRALAAHSQRKELQP